MKEIMLTGDRPTGKLHLGHYVGSLRKRVEIQNEDKYELYIMIADLQALTDNARNVLKIQKSIKEVLLDYLSVGIDPNKTTIFLQSQIPALFELPMFYSNLVTVSRLERNPTVKAEIKQKHFERSLPVGFFTYPISQSADITAFNAKYVPVGVDQLPMIEQTREIVESFNRAYKTDILTVPTAIIPTNENEQRLIGIDGNGKMSKSLNNGIYLSDSSEEVYKKVMKMYTDPNHVKLDDPGDVTNNVVFKYLDVFCIPEHFNKYLPNYNNLKELENHYKKGGLGDVVLKKFLYAILEEILTPIRERRTYFEENVDIMNILEQGCVKANIRANNTLNQVRNVIGINIFNNEQ